MSGRSAYVRAKNTERADKSAHKFYPEYANDECYMYSYSTGPQLAPTVSMNASYISSQTPGRRHSLSSSGSMYVYPPPPMRKPRPIIVASAIEKSDFRTHLDGMSSTLRGKLGRLLKNKDDPSPSNRRVPGSVTPGLDLDPRTVDLTPSIDAVPSLSPSTSPEAPTFPPAIRQPPKPPNRIRQQRDTVIHKIRKFEGGGKLPQLGWKSIASTPELWDEKGDTFVYMYMRGSRTKPPPSFRIDSRVIDESGSQTFMDKLYHTQEPEGWPKFYPYDQHFSSNLSPNHQLDSFDEFCHGCSSVPRSDEDDSDSLRPLSVSGTYTSRAPQGIRYEIYVPWPGGETGIHSTIWHITTRNFFAVMYNCSSLVGTTLYEATSILFQRINSHPEYLDRNISQVAWITDYIVRHKFDDVRNNPSYAASLLAFSELPDVQWREGYIEGFVHCVGMLNMGLQTIPEWQHITPHTKMFLQNASMEMEERIHRAQIWLSSFNFTEMWPTTSAPPTPARGCFDRLRKWLCSYYENAFLHWPPTNDETWLTHDMVVRLRNDFYGLYDYLVDHEVMFDGSEYRPGQKWIIAHQSSPTFRADTSELPLTDILVGFDDRHSFPHIPYPYPHTPKAISVHSRPKPAFTLKKPTSAAEIHAQSRRKALSYAEASNVYSLRDHYMDSELVTNFIKFEQGDMLDALDPFEARRGRWVLIYGILQVLATVSVDSPNLRYKAGTLYHLSPQMKGVVPWAEPGSLPEDEAEHKLSHCWIAPSAWSRPIAKARPGAHQPILWGQYGDGRVRAENRDKTPLPNVHETNVGRARAEEWVASHGGQHGDVSSDEGINGESDAIIGRSPDGEGHAEEYATEPEALAARRMRAHIHGFTNFEIPREW